MNTREVTRFATVSVVLLVALTLAGIFVSLGAGLGLLGSYDTASSLVDEMGATDETRNAAMRLMWLQLLPSLILGLIVAGLGTYALTRPRRLDGVTWRPILAGAILAVPLTLPIGLLASRVSGSM